MKKTLGLLLLILTSCGTPPKSNTDYIHIIGEPVKIENLEIAQYDFPDQMKWDEATAACSKLGPGWRLPTKDELNILYQNKRKIGNFNIRELYGYWSSTEYEEATTVVKLKWYQQFSDGRQFSTTGESGQLVRAVRSLNITQEEIRASTIQIPTTNEDYKNIIGIPIVTTNFVIAQYDFPKKMNWDDAEKACAALGKGWRLPNKNELNTLYENRDKIGGFTKGDYWSSFENRTGIIADTQSFLDGSHNFNDQEDAYYVRAVKSL
jgi:hypothetical protein